MRLSLQRIWLGLVVLCMLIGNGCAFSKIPLQAAADRSIALKLKQDVTLKLIWIPELSLWFGETEVSIEQIGAYSRAMANTTYFRTWPGYQPDWPAMNIPANYGEGFCNWLTHRVDLTGKEGYVFRQPTVSEWEAVARCGQDRIYPWGDAWPPGSMADGVLPNLAGEDALAMGDKNLPVVFQMAADHKFIIPGYRDGWPVICPVSKSGKNEWGIYGLAGNVEEWCSMGGGKGSPKYALKGGENGSFRPEQTRIDKDKILPIKRWPFFPLLEDRPSNYGTGLRIVLGKPLSR